MRTSPRRHTGGLILLYHRVAEPERDPLLLSVAPRRFEDHLEVIRRLAAPTPLASIQSASPADGRVPVAVTFDDGYADNFLAAAPLLEAAAVPATVFVVSGMVGADREFWWDELERALLAVDDAPASLELQMSAGGPVVRFDFSDGARPDPAWNILRGDTPSQYTAAYRALLAQLAPLESTARDAVIDELRRWAGVTSGVRATHRSLDEAELLRLDAHDFVEVGAHTVGHPSLAALTESQQRAEIEGSKSRLEELLGRPVTSFSYPFGGRDDYSRTTIRSVEAAGFDLACANVEGRVTARTDRYQLPRLLVRDWDGDELARRLQRWLDG
ncbi:MAG TPA: polysaccharide deacetylase family protein [Gaiellaceae bacterium]|jgi:peptidoglycan/xylan/chitin deacetylase (PgdA/CDA1 family)|nr:polysaccharide deacetylase family protein [Gaiellaceae bacterium]